MSKKFVALIVLLLMLVLPASSAFSSHTPLGREGRASFVPVDSPVTLVFYNANMRIRTGFTHVSITMAIRNDSETDLEFLMGMPTEYDQFSIVEDLSVTVRREELGVWIRRNTEEVPERWYAWTIPMLAGETVVADLMFSVSNKRTPEGGVVATLPLSYLRAFRGPVVHLNVIADLDLYGAYAFHPSPSIVPAEYARGGRLSFNIDGSDQNLSDLIISFIPLFSAVPDYIAAASPDNQEIIQLLNIYRRRDFEQATNLIAQFIVANPAFPYRRELEFLKSMANYELGRFDEVLQIYDRLEHRPGFTGVLSDAVRQKIIYDRSLMLTNNKQNDEALAYLETIESTNETDIFYLWLRDEVRRLTPPPPPPPPPVIEEPAEEPVEEEPAPVPPELTLTLSVETMTVLASLAFVVIFILYIIIRRRRRKRRRFYFSKG